MHLAQAWLYSISKDGFIEREVLCMWHWKHLSIILFQIRDQGSHEKGDFNETTNLLLTCKRQVIYPYFYMLSLVSLKSVNLLLRSLCVYILKQWLLFFSISVNSGRIFSSISKSNNVNYYFLQVSWRPFHIQSYHYQGCSVRKILNILYTLFIFVLIIFSYASSIIACQARLDIKVWCMLECFDEF